MNVLVIGSGGREHAIVDALHRSSQVDKIFAAPGNAGIAQLAECINIKDTDIDKLLDFAKNNNIALTVVGPEASLALGIVDIFKANQLTIFGPTKQAAQLESSKQWAKDIMLKYDVPTAKYQVFSDYDKCLAYVREQGAPIVLKYDGLAAGKGVVVAESLSQAEDAVAMMLKDDKFGQGKVLVEEYLTGPEFSFLCFASNGKAYPMPITQDHKRAFDGDLGPNTGGMGAYTPVPFITEEHKTFALNNVVIPMLNAMLAEGVEYTGVIYAGLMLTPQGIKVIEFNARFGDPETEVILPLLKSDIYNIFVQLAQGKEIPQPQWHDNANIGIVLASKGYPEDYEKGHLIEGLDNLTCPVFHMGTAKNTDGQFITNGGRVLFVTAQAQTLAEARDIAHKNIENIKCGNLFNRTDIAHQAIDGAKK